MISINITITYTLMWFVNQMFSSTAQDHIHSMEWFKVM